MKVTRMEADAVHGYLPIDVEFFPDITFLTGLNGSGKTTALRLLMGLLAPNLDELIDIRFKAATATVAESGHEVFVRAMRTSEGLELITSSVSEVLSLTNAELELLRESRPAAPRTPVSVKILDHPVFQAITKMSTPMFLGLDRRLLVDRSAWNRAKFFHNRDVTLRRGTIQRLWPSRHFSTTTAASMLVDVDELVVSTLSEIRMSQERLDEKLRNQILLDSFRFESAPFGPGSARAPSRAALNNFKARQATVEKAAAGLRLPVGELQIELSTFFERISQVVDSLENQPKQPKSVTGRPKKKDLQKTKEDAQFFVEWLMNSRQAQRIFKQIELLEEYAADRAQLREPIDRFLELANSFLTQTKKRVALTERGNLTVLLDKDDMDLPPFLTQPVKTQNPFKGELSHGIVEKDVHQRVQAGGGPAAGAREFAGRGSAGAGSEPERAAPLAA